MKVWVTTPDMVSRDTISDGQLGTERCHTHTNSIFLVLAPCWGRRESGIQDIQY